MEDRTGEHLIEHLGYLTPYRFDDLLSFFRDRALSGVEVIDRDSYSRTAQILKDDGNRIDGWIRIANDPEHDRLILEMSDSLVPIGSEIIDRAKRMFDIESDPIAIKKGIEKITSFSEDIIIDGVRLPGCFDPFETACRAILGQQVSVKAANKLAARIAEEYGEPIETGIAGLERAWPKPSTILGLPSIEDALGVLGVIKTRSHVIYEIARMIDLGEMDLRDDDPEDLMAKLLKVKGIGPWSANYIVMRTSNYPDAFLETDVGVAHALPGMSPKERMAIAEICRPWRSYAVLALWNSLTP